MKNYLLLFTLTGLIACNNHTNKETGDSDLNPNGIDSSEVIRLATKYGDSISNISPALKSTTVPLEDMSTEGGELTYYRGADSATLVLDAKNYGEMGQNREKIWLKNGKPVLQYLEEINYDKPMYEPSSKIANTTVTYLVFHNGAPFAMLDSTQRRIRPDSATFHEAAERIKAVLPDYLLQTGVHQ
jgi:hypothetical protein